mmetsp:Transcript_49153/g.91597  ORF Transcript_49153/g.91597 Transcript_49153/m.91597 type:complete len:243 (-) Transcript_49153:538-1266(-)
MAKYSCSRGALLHNNSVANLTISSLEPSASLQFPVASSWSRAICSTSVTFAGEESRMVPNIPKRRNTCWYTSSLVISGTCTRYKRVLCCMSAKESSAIPTNTCCRKMLVNSWCALASTAAHSSCTEVRPHALLGARRRARAALRDLASSSTPEADPEASGGRLAAGALPASRAPCALVAGLRRYASKLPCGLRESVRTSLWSPPALLRCVLLPPASGAVDGPASLAFESSIEGVALGINVCV